MSVPPCADEQLLERLLLPLLSEEAARDFLHRVAPELVSALEKEVLHAAAKENEHMARRIQRAREQVEQARGLKDLESATDPLVLPLKLLAPDSQLWDSWQREDLREALRQAIKNHEWAHSILASATPGSLTYIQARDRARDAERTLFEIEKEIALAWLKDKEAGLNENQPSQVEWHIETHLQIPIVVGDRPIDYLDAEIVVTVSTTQAFATQTFAVIVVPPDMGIIPALRRINVLRHFLPSETALVAITMRNAYISVLRQHNTYVYLVEDADIASD